MNNYIREDINVSLKTQVGYEAFKAKLSTLIKSTEGLKENTILFRGEKDVDLSRFKEGEINSFNGFISTSFNIKMAERFARVNQNLNMGRNPYIIKIKAPKGTKGVAINGNELGLFDNQMEWLLNHEQKYITKKVDSKNRIIEIELI